MDATEPIKELQNFMGGRRSIWWISRERKALYSHLNQRANKDENDALPNNLIEVPPVALQSFMLKHMDKCERSR